MSSYLNRQCLLVELTISQWTARRADKGVLAEIEKQHQARGVGTFTKHLIDKDALKPIHTAANELRSFHHENTLPWGNTARIITLERFSDYQQGLQTRMAQHQKQVQIFLDAYDHWKDKAKQDLNGLYQEHEYPVFAELQQAFGVRTVANPLPDASRFDDFRAYLGGADVDALKAKLEAEIQEQSRVAVEALWHRLRSAVKTARDALKKDNGRLYQNTFEKFNNLVPILCQLNISNDPKLDQLASQTKELFDAIDLDGCRNNPDQRRDTAHKVENLHNKMAAFF